MAVREDTLEFRILGPLEVCERGHPLDIGAGKQRALLALLLLRAGEVVSTDSVIDALWEERPPASAVNSVHVYVSQLRKVLGNERLETRGHGYLLALESEQLDLGRFERLLAEGRELLAEGEAERAGEALRAALALWRGRPLADFASEPFAQSEVARLEDMHLAALEKRIEADLACGRDADLVPELEALVREEPLREGLRAQLMLALYRSGRQAEALDAYQQARRVLSEEVGLEPGRTLQELERAILRQDIQLDRRSRTATPLSRARRRSGVLIALGAFLLLAAAVAVAVIERTGNERGSVIVPPNSLAAIDPSAGRVIEAIPLGGQPSTLAAGAGSLWVTNLDDRTLTRIQPETRALGRRIQLAGTPTGVTAGPTGVWISYGLVGSVAHVVPQVNDVVKTIPDVFGRSSGGAITQGEGAVWAASGSGELVRIDPRSHRVTGRVTVGVAPTAVAASEGAVWVAIGGSSGVSVVNPRTVSVVRSASVGSGPSGIAVGEGAVWVVSRDDGTVTRIDPNSFSAETIAVGKGATAVATGAGAVWVANSDEGTISRIDPKSRAVQTFEVGNRPEGIVVSAGVVWVTVQAE